LFHWHVLFTITNSGIASVTRLIIISKHNMAQICGTFCVTLTLFGFFQLEKTPHLFSQEKKQQTF
jgi:nitrate reductase gamma subunit